MLVLGHRGAPREAPENTLASFEAALRAGADGVELDVRRCASGEVICCHDPTLLRLAGEEVRVRTTSWSDLRRYDLGGATLCLLGDVLDLWSGRGVVNVELKSDDADAPALVRAALDVIVGAPRCAVIVSCFDPALLDDVAALAPDLARGQLVPPLTRPEAPQCLAALDRPGLTAVHPSHVNATPERIAAWRARGLDVNAWTVDDPARAVTLRDAGATAVITNVPAAVLAAVRVEGDDAGRREALDRLLERCAGFRSP
ncbi:MAG: glycerophosphodiester phosphodiesterase [Polyangiales bacterium]